MTIQINHIIKKNLNSNTLEPNTMRYRNIISILKLTIKWCSFTHYNF